MDLTPQARRPGRTRRALGALVVAACVAGGASADRPGRVVAERIEFEDGRTLIVDRLEIRGSVAHVDLGTGRAAFALDRIVSIGVVLADDPESEPPDPTGTTWMQWAGEWGPYIATSAESHRVDPVLVTAVIRIESNFDRWALSPKGACGLMQLIPATADRFGVEDVWDAEANIEGGVRYLRWLTDEFAGDTELVLAAYNAGEGAVRRYGGIPPYPETRNYVRKVMEKVDLIGRDRAGDPALVAITAP